MDYAVRTPAAIISDCEFLWRIGLTEKNVSDLHQTLLFGIVLPCGSLLGVSCKALGMNALWVSFLSKGSCCQLGTLYSRLRDSKMVSVRSTDNKL